ncbi:MAG: prepilin-type N-terminal cleavage/methylation domain-containing protein [Candidatus Saccharibacteria bacterium]
MFNKKRNGAGFTIVELLVVIIVIGILATITTVTYVGISKKADDAALATLINGNLKQQELYKAQYGSYITEVDQE